VTLVAAGGIGVVFSLVIGLVVIGGGGSSLANAAALGLRTGTVPAQYAQWVLKAGSLCPDTVGPAAIAAQIDAESNWNPTAVSSAGAAGIAQFMPGTWPHWAHNDDGTGNVSPFNPADAIMAQGRYMCALATTVRGYLTAGRAQGAVLDLALAGYNAGPGAVLAAGGIPHNGQTEVYVARIRQLMGKYSAPVFAGSGSTLGATIVAAAGSQIGTPYVWGGGDATGPTGGGSSTLSVGAGDVRDTRLCTGLGALHKV
jgi:cell wall-associated NlpC family hydrolase